MLLIEDGSSPRLYTQGEWQGEAALTLPLKHDDQDVGVVALGPRINGRPYSESEKDALQQSAETVAYLLHLRPARDNVPERTGEQP